MKKIFFAMVFLLGFGLMTLSAQAEPRRFVIAVGINQYFDQQLTPLEKAQNDAEEVGKLLNRLGGFRGVSVMTGAVGVTDPNYPTRLKIKERVDQLADLAKPSDQVVFFFSGHGINDPATGDSWLLPIDAQVKDPYGTSLNLRTDIIQTFQNKGINNLVLLVDACQKTVTKDKGMVITRVDRVKAAGAVIINATSPGKVSFEDPKGPNGLFTRSLLAGLSGEADLDRDGAVNLSELGQYLPDAVSEYGFQVGLSQKPTVVDLALGALQPPLVRLAAAPAVTVNPNATTTASQGTPAAPTAATSKAQFVSFRLPAGVRADLRVVEAATSREVLSLPDTSDTSPKLEPGNYRLEAKDRLGQYYPYSAPFTVGAAKVTVNVDLKPNFGSLSLQVTPEEPADVFLNGEKKGTLSAGVLTLEKIRSGTYDLTVSHSLYETRTLKVTVEDGKVNSQKITLSPNFFTLKLTPPAGLGGTVYVDGANRGTLPFTDRLPFRPTALRVVPTDPRYREWTANTTPRTKGGLETLAVDLEGRTGTLEITTLPDVEAQLTLGGQSIGTSPLDHSALVGDYDLAATATVNGKKLSATTRVTVREGQTSPVRLEMKEPVAPAPMVTPAAPPRNTGGLVDMVQVQGGTFMMGGKVRTTVSSFSIGRTEVTQAQWKAVMGTNPSEFKGDNLPVEQVSWYDAVEFCNKLSQKEGLSPAYSINGTNVTLNSGANGYRLPTEAQWEFAARGGNASRGTTYAGSATVEAVGWISTNSGSKTQPVGTKTPNEQGLYDMTGNVWEWCTDWYGGNLSGGTDPLGPASGTLRVIRGGSWLLNADSASVSIRYGYAPDDRYYFMGFRVVRP